MSLIVSAFWIDPSNGDAVEFVDWNDEHYAAGLESARQTIWGSTIIKGLGAQFLPLLSEGDLYVDAEHLDGFEEEVLMLRSNIDLIRRELQRGNDCALPHYFENFLRAIVVARQHRGGVKVT